VGDENPSEARPPADHADMDAAELATVARAIAEMTAALNAFVVTAHTLYPHLNADLKLRRALRAWRGETSHGKGGESPHEDARDLPTDP
jgi:hypothetical protein